MPNLEAHFSKRLIVVDLVKCTLLSCLQGGALEAILETYSCQLLLDWMICISAAYGADWSHLGKGVLWRSLHITSLSFTTSSLPHKFPQQQSSQDHGEPHAPPGSMLCIMFCIML